MGKGIITSLIVVTALCLLGLAQCAKETFDVEGKVYCDNCRVLFPTKISPYFADAEVELRCKDRANGTITFTMKGKTEKDGSYTLVVPDDHEDEICEVTAVSSPDPNCSETTPEISTGKVPLDNNSGIESKARYVNPIGFRQKKAASHCIETLDDLGFVPLKDMED